MHWESFHIFLNFYFTAPLDLIFRTNLLDFFHRKIVFKAFTKFSGNRLLQAYINELAYNFTPKKNWFAEELLYRTDGYNLPFIKQLPAALKVLRQVLVLLKMLNWLIMGLIDGIVELLLLFFVFCIQRKIQII